MKNTKKAFILSLAITALGGVLLYLYIRQAEERLSGGPKMQVIYAAYDIPIGVPIQKEMLSTREIPQAHTDVRHIPASEAESIFGIHTTIGIKAGGFVLWTDLAQSFHGGGSLASLIPKGKRAVALPVDTASSFSGMIRPGDRVDVLRTRSSENKRRTETLLQNVMVAAVGNKTSRERERSMMGKTNNMRSFASESITLALSPKDAQQMVHARTLGNLTLILRNPDDIRTNSVGNYGGNLSEEIKSKESESSLGN